MTVGWKEVDGKWYYFTDQGNMATGWWWLNVERFVAPQMYNFGDSGAMATGGEYLTGRILPDGRFETRDPIDWYTEVNPDAEPGSGVNNPDSHRVVKPSEQTIEYWRGLVEKYGYTRLQKVIVKSEDGSYDASLQYTVDFSKMPHNEELTPYDRFNLVKAKAYFDGYHFEQAQARYRINNDNNTVTYVFEFGSYF